jgi:hypothetical protein
VAVCTLAEIREKEREKFHIAALYGFSSTDIIFHGDEFTARERFSQERSVAMGLFEWRATGSLSLQVGAGGLLHGAMDHPELLGAERVRFEPGVVTMLGASYVLRRAAGPLPFVLLTGQFSALFASTQETAVVPSARYSAYDLRLGGAVGWTLFHTLSPYALARTFGGPVFWQLDDTSLIGSDRYRYQLGGGFSILIKERIDLFAEGVALGERGITAGAGVSF